MNTIADQLADPAVLAPPATTIRPGEASDADALERLSQLEDKDPGSTPHLVAEQDGEVVASLSLTDDVALGDPFRPTADLVRMLRVSARQAEPTRASELRFARRLAAFVSTLAVAGALAVGSALAAGGVSVAGAPVKINPQSKAFAISVSCTSEADPCEGVLDVKTAGKIKPYSAPAKVEKVGTFAFSIAAGTTALVKGRVYGPALAEATLRGKVRLSITPRALSGLLGPARSVLFTYKRR